MSKNQREKIGRNDPCPCGSGKKYKKCHGIAIAQQGSITPPSAEEIKKISEKLKAKEKQRAQQQGLGRPIISTVFKGYRFVAVGSRYCCQKEEKWQTFHDFLAEYMKLIFGKKWGSSEQKKTLEDRHPILKWAHSISKYRQKVLNESKGEIISSPMTGAVFAYLTLAYNLYLIAHNIHLVHGEGLHACLIKRLKNEESFYPAFYETMVAASFIKAGFQIELENEDDPSSNHAEFIAISPKTNQKYSVEAKYRQMGKQHTAIRNQLFNALKKDLPHNRVIFINLNIPGNTTNEGRVRWLDDVIRQMRKGQNTITINGKPAPKAYVFVTNHPFLYNLDSFSFPPAAVAEGFKIPDFRLDSAFLSLRHALKSREKHIDMLDLMKAMKEYDQIPSTFEGEIPEYAFREIKEPRLKIGNKYLVPDDSGEEVVGILQDAVVLENEKKVYGLYQLNNGKQILATCPLSGQEYKAFKQYPDTFFGVYKKHSKKAKDPLDLFDFFHGVYRNTPKQKLLKFLEGHADYEKLKNESQEELAIRYCEGLVYGAMRNKADKKQMG